MGAFFAFLDHIPSAQWLPPRQTVIGGRQPAIPAVCYCATGPPREKSATLAPSKHNAVLVGKAPVFYALRYLLVRRGAASIFGGDNPTRQLSLQPVAIGAAMEVTISPEPSMERAARRPREWAGRNVSERRAGLVKQNVGADPPNKRGRPLS